MIWFLHLPFIARIRVQQTSISLATLAGPKISIATCWANCLPANHLPEGKSLTVGIMPPQKTKKPT